MSASVSIEVASWQEAWIALRPLIDEWVVSVEVFVTGPDYDAIRDLVLWVSRLMMEAGYERTIVNTSIEPGMSQLRFELLEV